MKIRTLPFPPSGKTRIRLEFRGVRYLGPKLESTTLIVGTVPWNRECAMDFGQNFRNLSAGRQQLAQRLFFTVWTLPPDLAVFLRA